MKYRNISTSMKLLFLIYQRNLFLFQEVEIWHQIARNLLISATILITWWLSKANTAKHLLQVCVGISRKNIDSTLATFDGVSLQRGTRYYKTFQTNSIDTFDLACQCANSLIAPNTQQTFSILGVAAIAPWFCLRLPSCGPRFESQAHHLRFFSICIIEIVSRK